MRLLYLNVIEEHAGWGAEVFLNKALQKAGVYTYTVDYRRNRHHLARAFREAEGRFDCVLLQRGDFFPLEIVRAINIPKIFLFTELIARCSDADHLFESNLFDSYLVRGPNCMKALALRGYPEARKIAPFLSAFDRDTYRPMDETKDLDCVFVGTMTPRRERVLAEISRHVAIRTFSAFGGKASQLFNRARIVLNVHADDMPDTETRVFEALGSRAFLISEKLSEENPFVAGKHYVEAHDFPEMVSLIRYYRDRVQEREDIASAGAREAMEHHTYDARASQLLGIFEQLVTPRDGDWVDRHGLRSYGRREEVLRMRELLWKGLRSVKSRVTEMGRKVG